MVTNQLCSHQCPQSSTSVGTDSLRLHKWGCKLQVTYCNSYRYFVQLQEKGFHSAHWKPRVSLMSHHLRQPQADAWEAPGCLSSTNCICQVTNFSFCILHHLWRDGIWILTVFSNAIYFFSKDSAALLPTEDITAYQNHLMITRGCWSCRSKTSRRLQWAHSAQTSELLLVLWLQRWRWLQGDLNTISFKGMFFCIHAGSAMLGNTR